MPSTFGDENMAVFSVIKLSELEGAKRIAAEFYTPRFLKITHTLISLGAKPLKNYITLLYRYPTFYNLEYRKEGVLVLKGEDIVQEGFVQNQSQDYISLEDASRFPKTILEEGDLIFSVRGYVGKIGIIDKKYIGSIISANLIRAKISGLSSYFVWVFLNSKFGSSQLDRIKMMTSQETVVANDIRNLLIFEPSKNFQEKIETLSISAINQIRNSENLYSQAESLLLEELGLKDFKPKYEKTYSANLSDAFSAHRIDAEYFQPAYEEVIEKIKNYKNGFVLLLKSVENVKPDFDPTKYSDKIFSYVELADIDSAIGVVHSVNEVRGEEAPSRARRLLKAGDVIVSSVEGSLERVALIDKEHDACLASTGFFQFRPLDILPEVLLILSKTIVLQSQLKKRCSGTILTAVSKESLRDIIIPILPLSTQQKIASLVQKSHDARRKAKELLEVAKKAVEIAIEKNEKEALDYISKAEENENQ
jgi:type I restriction enzyme S subunit